LFDLRIFIDCPARTRWRRRLARDISSRGRNRASVYQQFWKTVEPMHARFVAPQRRWADIILPGLFRQRDVAQIARRLRTLLKSRSELPFALRHRSGSA
jgi:uridine kinase